MARFGSIVITGASSGIGAALAADYAAPGVALALTGRDSGRLDEIAATCRSRGAEVETTTIDVTDRTRFEPWLLAFDERHPVDLILANAGVSLDKGHSADAEITRRTFAINVDGVFNTVFPLLPRLQARGRGQIAVVSSLASFIGLPRSAAYCASKAALRVWGEGLRYSLKRSGIGVSVVCPGFVVSRMTASNPFPMPFLMDAARASGIIRRGLERNAARIAFPFPTRAAIWLAELLPMNLLARAMGG